MGRMESVRVVQSSLIRPVLIRSRVAGERQGGKGDWEWKEREWPEERTIRPWSGWFGTQVRAMGKPKGSGRATI